MKCPLKVRCKLLRADGSHICRVDKEGWGDCGDAIIFDNRDFCLWVEEILEWQDIEPVYLQLYKRSDDGAC